MPDPLDALADLLLALPPDHEGEPMASMSDRLAKTAARDAKRAAKQERRRQRQAAQQKAKVPNVVTK